MKKYKLIGFCLVLLNFVNCITTKEIGTRLEIVKAENANRYGLIYKNKLFYKSDWLQKVNIQIESFASSTAIGFLFTP